MLSPTEKAVYHSQDMQRIRLGVWATRNIAQITQKDCAKRTPLPLLLGPELQLEQLMLGTAYPCRTTISVASINHVSLPQLCSCHIRFHPVLPSHSNQSCVGAPDWQSCVTCSCPCCKGGWKSKFLAFLLGSLRLKMGSSPSRG